jgi:hypothetical protein
MRNAYLFNNNWRRTESPFDSRLGTVRQRDEFVPKLQLWFRSAQHWLTDLDSIPKIDKQPVFDRSGDLT